MENQHQKITGYRDLSQVEIDLMNEIKAHAVTTEALIEKVGAHVNAQHRSADGDGLAVTRNESEMERLNSAQPARWLSMARTDLQTGFMKLVRAVAQPTTF